MPGDPTIDPADAERYYDRLGAKLDRYRAFEERARDDLLEHGRFREARAVAEFGCGTGRLAERLLAQFLPAEARYSGTDLSTTMVDLSRRRLARFGNRAVVRKADGAIRVPEADGSCDRFVATYVLDLLSVPDQRALLDEARRILAPEGLAGIAALADGNGPVSRWVSRTWKRVQSRNPARVGGCRPIRIREVLERAGWTIRYHRTLTMLGVPAEVAVASPGPP